MKWRVYYNEGKTFSDADGTPYEAPVYGVQLILQPDPDTGRFILSEGNFYWYDASKDYWFSGDFTGLYQYLAEPGPKRILLGRLLRWGDYQECLQRALADPDFPPKSAKHPLEKFDT